MAEAQKDELFGNPIGERLRVAREAKGLSLEDVARQTRIPVRHLQHIERGEWDALPAPTYTVGFTRSYANAIGLDGPALGAELREQLGGSRSTPTMAPAYYEPADPARVPPRSIALVAAILAVLLVAGYFIWRSGVDDGSDVRSTVAAEAPPPAAGQPAQPAATAPNPAAANGPVVLTATEDVWLRIYEGEGGPSLFEGTLRAGERYEVPAGARAPQIRTGRANALRVTVGQTEIPPLGPPERTISDVSLRPADLIARGQAAPAAATPAAPAAIGTAPAQ